LLALRILSVEGEDTLTLSLADAQALALDIWQQHIQYEPDFYRA
jgi:hypothetical protein